MVEQHTDKGVGREDGAVVERLDWYGYVVAVVDDIASHVQVNERVLAVLLLQVDHVALGQQGQDVAH